ncbi:MAG: T9SS type A sorting domain-containing protein [Bacteroidota bacterium]
MITNDNNYCAFIVEKGLPQVQEGKDHYASQIQSINDEKAQFFKVYPNPTTGQFALGMTGEDNSGVVMVTVSGMMGETILNERMSGIPKREFSIEKYPIGNYLIRVTRGEKSGTLKIIRY